MTCDDLLRTINDYVDGEIDPAICSHLQAHLDDCEACRVVVDTLGKTVSLYRASERVAQTPLEPHVKMRLEAAVRAQWQRQFAEPNPDA